MSETLQRSQDPVARWAEQVRWISPEFEKAAQAAIQKPFREGGPTGEKLLSFLHGHWLHEPLHVVLTDVPVGAWSVTAVSDALAVLSGSDRMNTVADASLLIGLVGAAGAAVTGLADWSEIQRERPRRIGAVHAVMNVAATGLYAASCLTRRKRGGRTLPRSLALLGYVLVSLSAHLGGNLIYEHGVGVRGQENGVRR